MKALEAEREVISLLESLLSEEHNGIDGLLQILDALGIEYIQDLKERLIRDVKHRESQISMRRVEAGYTIAEKLAFNDNYRFTDPWRVSCVFCGEPSLFLKTNRYCKCLDAEYRRAFSKKHPNKPLEGSYYENFCRGSWISRTNYRVKNIKEGNKGKY
jgi:hypothetical protein